MFDIDASGAADPTLANGNQGPLLLTAKARAAPSVEEARIAAKQECGSCASPSLLRCARRQRVCRCRLPNCESATTTRGLLDSLSPADRTERHHCRQCIDLDLDSVKA